MKVQILDDSRKVRVDALPVGALFRYGARLFAVCATNRAVEKNVCVACLDADDEEEYADAVWVGKFDWFAPDKLVEPEAPPDFPGPTEQEKVRVDSLGVGAVFMEGDSEALYIVTGSDRNAVLTLRADCDLTVGFQGYTAVTPLRDVVLTARLGGAK